MEFSDLSKDEMPREKLLRHGAASLTLAELVAILLRTGTKEESVLDMAHNLINKMGGIEGLARATAAELMQEKGLKAAKTASLAAALELGNRIAASKSDDYPEWQKALREKAFKIKHSERESIFVFFLNAKERVLGSEELSYGGITGAYLDLPVFFRKAARVSAAKIVLLHNHPDGCKKASREDVLLTEHIERGLEFLAIQLKGHYIAADGELFLVKGDPLPENKSPRAAEPTKIENN